MASSNRGIVSGLGGIPRGRRKDAARWLISVRNSIFTSFPRSQKGSLALSLSLGKARRTGRACLTTWRLRERGCRWGYGGQTLSFQWQSGHRGSTVTGSRSVCAGLRCKATQLFQWSALVAEVVAAGPAATLTMGCGNDDGCGCEGGGTEVAGRPMTNWVCGLEGPAAQQPDTTSSIRQGAPGQGSTLDGWIGRSISRPGAMDPQAPLPLTAEWWDRAKPT